MSNTIKGFILGALVGGILVDYVHVRYSLLKQSKAIQNKAGVATKSSKPLSKTTLDAIKEINQPKKGKKK